MLRVLYYLTVIVGVLVAVSFYTLYERKVLSLGHLRVGPRVVGYYGLLQPFSDAIKLFTKESFIPSKANTFIFCVCPGVGLLLMLVCWVVVPQPPLVFNLEVGIMLFFIISAAQVYFHLGVGWGSNSNYSLLGSLRCVAQRVSYEVCMVFLILAIGSISGCLNISTWGVTLGALPLGLVLSPLCVIWVVRVLAETNRRPFDFAEGESELVSGFNVEYGSGGFAVLFIREYGSMVFNSLLIYCLLFGGFGISLSGLVVVGVCLYGFIWSRVTFPRTRYDKLMALCWLKALPVTLSVIVLLALS